jgi:predicted transcriptional regulator
MEHKNTLVDLTSQIVSSFVGKNAVAAAELPKLIADVYGALSAATEGRSVTSIAPGTNPAVPPKKSIHPDYLVCLEDGKKFKSLKRHLRTHYNLSPEAYREKWGLAPDYPMVAPNYAKTRSNLAKSMGLGRKPGKKR